MATEDIRAAAEQIDRLCQESGLGFLLARVVADGILEGTIDPGVPQFERVLQTRAYDLLLEDGGRGEGRGAKRASLVHALALAPDPGIPLGEAWQKIAQTLDPEAPADIEAQLATLADFRRLVIEERHHGEPVYRWFHPGLRHGLRDAVGGLRSDRGHQVVQSLLELRDRQTGHWAAPEKADWFLLESLPQMVVECGDGELMRDAAEGAPEAEAKLVLSAILDEAADRRALGDREAAQDLAQEAMSLTYGREDSVAALALLGQAEALTLDFDMWRDGRDMSRSALAMVERLLEAEPDRVDLLEAAIRATRVLALALGIGAFDAGEGVGYVERMLERVAEAGPEAQATLAPVIAELLQSYADSLRFVSSPRVRAESATAAATIRGQMIAAGREDLRVPYTESLCYAWMAREGLGDPGGLDPFRDSLMTILAIHPTPPDWVLGVSGLVGQLAQALGFDGREDEAIEVLDTAVKAYSPSVERASPEEGYPLGLATVLGMRSTVLAGMGHADAALDDAYGAVELSHRHSASGMTANQTGTVLALRLLEREEPGSAKVPFPLPWPDSPAEVEIEVGNLVAASILRRRGDSGEAIARLMASLSRLDPGGVQPPPPIREELFITVGIELRVGLELGRAFVDQGEEKRATEALERAATIFLRRHLAASPGRLLLLEPRLRELAIPLVRETCERSKEWGRLALPWMAALPAIERGEWTPGVSLLGDEIDEVNIQPAELDLGRVAFEKEEPIAFRWPAAASVETIQRKLQEGLSRSRQDFLENS